MLSEYAITIKTILYRNLVGFLSSVVMSRVTLFKNIFSHQILVFWTKEKKNHQILVIIKEP